MHAKNAPMNSVSWDCQVAKSEEKSHQAKGFLCFFSAAGEFDNLLATRDVSHLCHVFSRRDILLRLRREKPVLQEGIICFNRLSYRHPLPIN